jgi:DNA-binding response OmpR family regulator
MEDSNATILILEPDNALRDLITLALRRLGYRVITAADWMDALALFQQQRPQVLVLAVLLPQMNGIDLLRYFKAQGWLEHTAVILISALGYREIIQKAVAAGAKDFLVKPFDVEVLLGKVQKIVAEMGGNTGASFSHQATSAIPPEA